MRLAGLRSLLLLVFAVAIAGAVAGCDNPFDPLKSSSKIEGLTYFDFATSPPYYWDSDPESDGLEITLNYYNEFSDGLNFHDKSHMVQIDIWSEKSSGEPPVVTRKFLTSKTVEFSNSDDAIRIPIEYYGGFLSIADPPEEIKGCLQIRIFPPQEYPQRELVAPVQCDIQLFLPEEVIL